MANNSLPIGDNIASLFMGLEHMGKNIEGFKKFLEDVEFFRKYGAVINKETYLNARSEWIKSHRGIIPYEAQKDYAYEDYAYEHYTYHFYFLHEYLTPFEEGNRYIGIDM